MVTYTKPVPECLRRGCRGLPETYPATNMHGKEVLYDRLYCPRCLAVMPDWLREWALSGDEFLTVCAVYAISKHFREHPMEPADEQREEWHEDWELEDRRGDHCLHCQSVHCTCERSHDGSDD